jgi:hypothetical protein
MIYTLYGEFGVVGVIQHFEIVKQVISAPVSKIWKVKVSINGVTDIWVRYSIDDAFKLLTSLKIPKSQITKDSIKLLDNEKTECVWSNVAMLTKIAPSAGELEEWQFISTEDLVEMYNVGL